MEQEIIRIKAVDVDGKPSVEVLLHGDERHLENLLFSAILSTPKLKSMMLNAVTVYLYEQTKEMAENGHDINQWLMELELKSRLN
jgi:hypothetical protein